MGKTGFYFRQFSLLEWVGFGFTILIARIQQKRPKEGYESWRVFRWAYADGRSSRKVGNSNLISWKIGDQNLEVYARRRSSDFAVLAQVFIDQEYNPLIFLTDKFKIKVDTIIDAGANIGMASLFFNLHFPGSKIVALEPHGENFNMLKQNIEKNGASNITALNEAIWFKNSTVNLKNDFGDRREWSFRVTDEKIEGKQVLANTLLGLMSENKLLEIDILKIDVEGAEIDIVMNDTSFLSTISQHVKLIAIELHGAFEVRHHMISELINNSFDCYPFGETVFAVNKKLCLPR